MKRTLIIFSIILLVLFGVSLWFGLNFKPGSYPDAEYYEVDATEDDLLAAIATFKRNAPEYNVPKGAGWIDGRDTKDSYWYFVYFYLPEAHQTIRTWTRPDGPNRTTFALVSVNDGLKQEFETKILVKIKQLLKKQKP